MNVQQIMEALKQERSRIDTAIAALSGSSSGNRGASTGKRGRRKMSAEAKAKIAAAQKARWARVKAAQKKK